MNTTNIEVSYFAEEKCVDEKIDIKKETKNVYSGAGINSESLNHTISTHSGSGTKANSNTYSFKSITVASTGNSTNSGNNSSDSKGSNKSHREEIGSNIDQRTKHEKYETPDYAAKKLDGSLRKGKWTVSYHFYCCLSI